MDISSLTNDAILDFTPWVKTIVKRSMRIYPKNPRWDETDIESVVWVALIESWKSFEPKKHVGVPFKAYAKQHIVNHIKKFVGVNMFTLKADYENVVRSKNAEGNLNKLHNIEVTAKRQYNIEDADANSGVDDDGIGITRSFDEVVSDYRTLTHEIVEQKDFRTVIRDELNKLPAYEKKLIKLRYYDGKNVKEISKELHTCNETIRTQIKNIEKKLTQRFGDKEWQHLL